MDNDFITNQPTQIQQTPPTATPAPIPTPVSTAPPPQAKNRKNTLWLVLAGIILAASMLAAGYYLGQQNNGDPKAAAVEQNDAESRDTEEPVEKTTVTPVDSYAGWNNSSDIDLPFSNYTPTFSFKYPSSWKHVKPGEGAYCGIYVSPTATTWTNVDSTVNVCGDGKSTRTLLSAAGGFFRDIPVASAESLTVKGRNAIQVESEPQTEGEQTVISLVTVIDDVKLPSTYSDIVNGVRVMTDVGYLFISGQYRGDSAGFDAFKKDYQLIVNSIEVK